MNWSTNGKFLDHLVHVYIFFSQIHCIAKYNIEPKALVLITVHCLLFYYCLIPERGMDSFHAINVRDKYQHSLKATLIDDSVACWTLNEQRTCHWIFNVMCL